MRREEGEKDIGISIPCFFVGVCDQEIGQLSYPATMKMGKDVYMSLSMLCYCYNFLTRLLLSLWVKEAAAAPFLHSYMKSRRETSALMNDCSMGRKGQQSQELICC